MDVFMKSDLFEDFNRESNQTARHFDKGIENATSKDIRSQETFCRKWTELCCINQ